MGRGVQINIKSSWNVFTIDIERLNPKVLKIYIKEIKHADRYKLSISK